MHSKTASLIFLLHKSETKYMNLSLKENVVTNHFIIHKNVSQHIFSFEKMYICTLFQTKCYEKTLI